MNRYSTSIKYGVLAGLIMIILMMVMYFISRTSLASWITIAIYIPLIFLMIWGGITVRKELNGYENFKQAFLAVFLVSIIATMMFDSFGVLLYRVIDPELPEVIKEKAISNAKDMMERFNTPEEKVDETISKMEEQDYTPTVKSQLIRYASSLVIGVILSLIIALFVRRRREDAVQHT